jgi:peptide/nickel transport system permease protein
MIRTSYGWGEPIIIQYAKYLKNMFTFGLAPPYFGWSRYDRQFVASGLSWRLPITVFLLTTSLTGAMILGITLGTFAASQRRTKRDVGTTAISLWTWGIPLFFVQLMAIAFFGRILRDFYGIKIFSTTYNPPRFTGDLAWFMGTAAQLTLPILTMILTAFGSWTLYTRNLLTDSLTQDYINTARAKGLSNRKILYSHAFRSILPPISTMITRAIPTIVTGSMITEIIFGINGIGSWYIKSIQVEEVTIHFIDPPVVQAVFFIFAALVVTLNLIADLSYGILDPRIRIGKRK